MMGLIAVFGFILSEKIDFPRKIKKHQLSIKDVKMAAALIVTRLIQNLRR